jgi:hypothetical protein
MRRHRAFAQLGVMAPCIGACLASCTPPLVAPGEPRIVERLAVAPYAAHEQCAALAAGDRLDYRFESSAPLDFDIRYRQANAVLSPIARGHATSDSGIFEAREPARYCLDWQAGVDGAILGYRIVVRRNTASSSE